MLRRMRGQRLLHQLGQIILTVASRHGGRGRVAILPLNFSLQSENFVIVGKFSSKKYQIWGWKFAIWGNLGPKLKFQAP